MRINGSDPSYHMPMTKDYGGNPGSTGETNKELSQVAVKVDIGNRTSLGTGNKRETTHNKKEEQGISGRLRNFWDRLGKETAEPKEEIFEQPQQSEKVNPYFVPVETTDTSDHTLSGRIRKRVVAISTYLAGHFPFFRNGFLQNKQEKNKENLKKRSKYKENDNEIDCVLTDDSYLMDSYDRNGSYRSLSTEDRKDK